MHDQSPFVMFSLKVGNLSRFRFLIFAGRGPPPQLEVFSLSHLFFLTRTSKVRREIPLCLPSLQVKQGKSSSS